MRQVNKIHNFSLKKQDIKYFLLLFPFCSLQFVNFEYRTSLNLSFEILKIAAVLYYFLHLKRTKMEFNIIVCLLIAYELTYLIPSILDGSLTLRTFYLWIKEAYSFIFLGIIISTLLKENYLRAINILYKILSFSIILHVIFSIVSEILVLGIQTRFGDTYTIAIVLLLVKMEILKKRLSLYDCVFIILSSYFIFTKWISTLVVLDILLLLIFIFSNSKFLLRTVKYYTLVPFAVILNFSILFFRIQVYFKWLIADFLHEDLTLNNRTIIWDNIFREMNNNNIFIGAGISGENTRDIPIEIYNQYGHLLFGNIQAHNQLLSVLYWNGIIGLIIYLIVILISGVNLKKCNKKVAMYYIAGTFLISLSMITELSANGNYFIIFIMCMYYCRYSDNYIVQSRKKVRRIVWSR